MSTVEKPHVSATQVGMFCRCGEQYRRRYVEKHIIPPGMALHVGSGYHVGAEVNCRQKIESRRDLPVADIVDAAVAGFDARINADGCELTEEEASRGLAVTLGEAKDRLVILSTLHATEQAPDYQPVAVEETCRIILPRASRDLLGILDLADDRDRIVDFKTGARKKPQSAADESLQLTVYAAAFMATRQRPPAEVLLDSAISTKKPTRQVLTSRRDQNDIRALAARLSTVIAAIDAGVFVPCNQDSFWCSTRWCGYARTCSYFSGRAKE